MKHRLIGYQELLPDKVPDDQLKALDPFSHVVYSGAGSVNEARDRAPHVKTLLPDCLVFLRLFGDNDQSGLVFSISPQDAAKVIFAKYRPLWQPGIALFFDNEPGVNNLEARAAFYVALMDLASAEHIPIGYGAFSTGTPDIPDYGKMLPAFQRAAYWRTRNDTQERVVHWWTAHGYFDPRDEGARFYHLDRPRREAAAVCKSAGVLEPLLNMSEIGCDYDISGKGYHTNDELPGAKYAAKLKEYALTFPANVYCAGRFGDAAESMNVLDDSDFNQGLLNYPLVEYGDKPVTQPTIHPPSTGGVLSTLSKIPGSYINVRIQPYASADDKGDLHLGDVGTFFPDALVNGWGFFLRSDDLFGWVSLQGGAVVFTPVPPAPSGIVLTPEQYGVITSALVGAQDALAGAQQGVNDALTVLREVQPPATGGGFR